MKGAMNGKILLNCWVLGALSLSKLNISDTIPCDEILRTATDRSPTEALLLRHGSVVEFCYITHRVARAVIVFINMANSSHLGFCVKMVSKLFTDVYNGNQMSAFEEIYTSFVFLVHWVPAMINKFKYISNGGCQPSWISALQGHSRRQLLVRIDSLTSKTYVLTPISTL